MRVIKTIKPGQNGSLRFLKRFGERLISVRYREDPKKHSIFTTVEIIVEQRDSLPGTSQSLAYAHRDKLWVALQIGYDESDLRAKVKSHGARWSKAEKVWVMRYKQAAEIGVLDRVVPNLAARITDVDLFE